MFHHETSLFFDRDFFCFYATFCGRLGDAIR